MTIANNHISDSAIGIASRSPNTVIRSNTIVNSGVPNVSSVVGPMKDQDGIYTCEQGHINLVVQDNTITYDTRWCGETHGQPMYGTGININGNPSETGHAEFDNQYVIVKGNVVQVLPRGNGIYVGSNTGVIKSQSPPFAVPLKHYPSKVHVEGNTVTGSGEWSTITVLGSLQRTDAFVTANTVDTASSSGPAFQASQLKSLTLTRNTVPAKILPSWREEVSPTIVVADVNEVSITANALGPISSAESAAIPKDAMPGRGCLVPSLTNVSSASHVESFGTGCPSGTVAPLATGAATEITAWSAGGGLAKALIVNGQITTVTNSSGSDAILMAVVGSHGQSIRSVVVHTASGVGHISFRAMSL